MQKVLIVSDAHITPGENLRRFTWLGHFLQEQQPDLLVQLGDWASMESLSHWDKDKRLLIEGRRIVEDLKVAREAWKILEGAVEDLQTRQRKQKLKLYRPELYWFDGNHEDWVYQYIQRNPEWEGMIHTFDNLNINSSLFTGVSYLPWKSVRANNGVLYTHAPIGRTGPISSKYISSRTLAEISSGSVVYGHTHRRNCDTIARYTDDGMLRTIRAVNAGCYFEQWPDYAQGNTNDYWQGVLLLHVYSPGNFDVEEWSLERVRRYYE